MTPKYSPILWWPPKKYPQNPLTQKLFIFLKTPQIWILKILNPQKWPEPTMYENIRVPGPPPPPPPPGNVYRDNARNIHARAFWGIHARAIPWKWTKIYGPSCLMNLGRVFYNFGGVGKGGFCMWAELAWGEFVLGRVVCNSSSICRRSMNFAGGLHDFLHNLTVPA